jgi:hypothetical protein
MVSVVGVHICHFSDVPYLQASITRHSVELIVLFIKTNASDRVSMTHESLDLLLRVNIPDPYDSVLPATNEVLTIG